MTETALTHPNPDNAVDSSDHCLNCGTPLTGKYCTECGQPTRLPSLSFWLLLKELVEDLWDVDSKTWRSLAPLMFKPGYLTNAYFAGRRARYVSPLRLYMTVSVLFFVIAAITDNTIRLSWEDPGAERATTESMWATANTNILIAEGVGCDVILQDVEARWLQDWRKRAVIACEKVTADSGQSLERAAIDNTPIMMVVFIPVLALVMKLLYRGSKPYFMEHLVFFMHFHAFGFIVLILDIFYYELGSAFGWPNLAWRIVASIAATYMAVYLLVAMRRVYAQGWLITSAKYLLLYLAYFVGLSLSLTIVVIYTAMTL